MDLSNYTFDNGSGLWINYDTGDTMTDAQYQAAMATSASTAAASSDWPTLTALVNALPSIATGLTSLELSQVNVQRAKSGLAPVNPALYGPQVNVGLSSSTTTMLLLLAAGLGAVLLMSGRK